MDNLILVHGGGPTAVINNSLVGALTELKKRNFKGKIYGAKFGTSGLLKGDFVDLTNVSQAQLQLLANTPGSAIGTGRQPLTDDDYSTIADVIKQRGIKYVLFNGGNGTMDACGKVYKKVKDSGVICVGIPKTVDNDICVGDHTPGFASCAKYIATAVSEVIQDVRSMPIHVSVIESMGRNAGFLTAASALSGNGRNAPDLIYCPENDFDEDAFLTKVEGLFRKQGGVVVVASEGLKYKDGKQIVEPIFTVGRATYFGDVSAHLANLVIKRLGVKARSEKPGLLQRCSMSCVSEVDRTEAQLVGSQAVASALNGNGGVMIAIERVSTNPYVIQTVPVPLEKVMLEEKRLASKYFTPDKDGITEEYKDWLRPLIGAIPEYVTFTDK